MMRSEINREASSFRDPSGFIYKKDDEIYRQINFSYKKNYDLLMSSGLYKKLVDKEYLISHREVEPLTDGAYKTIKPNIIPFISYPYEWSFSMLKDAALLTLRIQKISLKNGITLKDASSYNVQFLDGKPVFIDTLSFEEDSDMPWIVYGQFCRHFLAPLLLMSYCDIRLQSLLKNYIDGIPLDLTSKLLPKYTKFIFSILIHIHIHSRMQIKYENKTDVKIKRSSIREKIVFIDALISFVKSISWKSRHTEWADYYQFTNYADESFESKKNIVTDYIDLVKPKFCWDLGANNGFFTRLSAKEGIQSISFDIDPNAVEDNYIKIKHGKENNIIPLICDLTNLSPAIGWNCSERMSLKERGNKIDLVMALALIHHLAISNNLPLNKIAEFFSGICENLIIEFVPKSDSKVKILLSTRKDIFDDYNIDTFENEFKKFYVLKEKRAVLNSDRIIYLFSKK